MVVGAPPQPVGRTAISALGCSAQPFCRAHSRSSTQSVRALSNSQPLLRSAARLSCPAPVAASVLEASGRSATANSAHGHVFCFCFLCSAISAPLPFVCAAALLARSLSLSLSHAQLLNMSSRRSHCGDARVLASACVLHLISACLCFIYVCSRVCSCRSLAVMCMWCALSRIVID